MKRTILGKGRDTSLKKRRVLEKQSKRAGSLQRRRATKSDRKETQESAQAACEARSRKDRRLATVVAILHFYKTDSIISMYDRLIA